MDIYEQEDMHGFLNEFFKKTAAANDILKTENYLQNEMTDFLGNQPNKPNDEGYFEDEAEQLDDEDEFEDDDDDNEYDDEKD